MFRTRWMRIGHKVDWDEIHSSLSAIIRQYCDPVVVAMDVCVCWCKAHMGPPAAVPLRDASCVMILLHLSLLLPLPRSLFPSGSNFWQDFRTWWRLSRNMERCISKQGKKNMYGSTQQQSTACCSALWEVAGDTSWHPVAVWPLASMLHVLFLIYAVGCLSVSPPADNPSKENGERWSRYDAGFTPLLKLQAHFTPLCSWTYLPQTQLLPTKRKNCKRRKKITSPFSLLAFHAWMSSIWQMLTPDIEIVVSDCTANSCKVCLSPCVNLQFDMDIKATFVVRKSYDNENPQGRH